MTTYPALPVAVLWRDRVPSHVVNRGDNRGEWAIFGRKEERVEKGGRKEWIVHVDDVNVSSVRHMDKSMICVFSNKLAFGKCMINMISKQYQCCHMILFLKYHTFF